MSLPPHSNSKQPNLKYSNKKYIGTGNYFLSQIAELCKTADRLIRKNKEMNGKILWFFKDYLSATFFSSQLSVVS